MLGLYLFTSPQSILLAAVLTLRTSLYVRLTLVPLMFLPPSCSKTSRSPSKPQFATLSSPSSSSTSTDEIPCIGSRYALPVVISSDLGSWNILVGKEYSPSSPSLGGKTSKHKAAPRLTVATTSAYASPSSCGMMPSPALYSLTST